MTIQCGQSLIFLLRDGDNSQFILVRIYIYIYTYIHILLISPIVMFTESRVSFDYFVKPLSL